MGSQKTDVQANLASLEQQNSIEVDQDIVQIVQLKGKVTVEGDISQLAFNEATVIAYQENVAIQASTDGQLNFASLEQQNSIDVDQDIVQIVELKGKVTVEGDISQLASNEATVIAYQGNIAIQANADGHGSWKKLAGKLDGQLNFASLEQQNSIDVDQDIVQIVQLKGKVTVEGDISQLASNEATVIAYQENVAIQANADVVDDLTA